MGNARDTGCYNVMRQGFFKRGGRGLAALAALALLMASNVALALGLGEIRVKSQPGHFHGAG